MDIREILNMKGNAVYGIAPGAPLSEAVHAMARRDIGSLAVMEGDRLVGMLSFREVIKALDQHPEGVGARTVAEVMERNPIFGSPDDSVDYVRGVMTRNHARYLPVMEGDRLIGVISFYDVARACLADAGDSNHLLKRYGLRWPE